jgi:hypothetical protein
MLNGLMGECGTSGDACTTEDGEPIERSIELPDATDTVSIFGIDIPVWLIVAGVGLALLAGSDKGNKR